MSTAYIISANYRDRSSVNKWLVREESQKPEQAIPVKSVVATGVVFQGSNHYESGFGCSTVARALDVDYHFDGYQDKWGDTYNKSPKVKAKHQDLGFNGSYFYLKDSEKMRNTLEELVLLSDGKMKALV